MNKQIGTIINVRNNDDVKPPIITISKTFVHLSAPARFAKAIGNIPKIMAIVVIKIGRRRA